MSPGLLLGIAAQVTMIFTGLLSLLFALSAAGQKASYAAASEDELPGPRSNQEEGIASSYTDGSLRGSLILENGTIYTMDGRGRVVTVVGIDDGRIVYVGNSSADAAKLFFKPPRVINLKRRMTVPGLIDCHNHIAILGNKPGYHHPLERAYSVADVQAVYRKAASEVPRGKFITTIGAIRTFAPSLSHYWKDTN